MGVGGGRWFLPFGEAKQGGPMTAACQSQHSSSDWGTSHPLGLGEAMPGGHHFAFLPARYEGSDFPTSSASLVISLFKLQLSWQLCVVSCLRLVSVPQGCTPAIVLTVSFHSPDNLSRS